MDLIIRMVDFQEEEATEEVFETNVYLLMEMTIFHLVEMAAMKISELVEDSLMMMHLLMMVSIF